MRVVLVAAAIFALSGTVALAQAVPKYGETDKDKTPSDIAAEKAAEKAYNRSLGNIPDKGPGDPWGAVRSPDAPKTAATKAKSKASTAPN
jgi:hypothetical protein